MSVELKGLDELTEGLGKLASLKKQKEAVKKHASNLQKRAMRNANFRGHYEGKKFVNPTGATKRSISLKITDGGMTGVVKTGTHYSGYLEVGTRFMSAQPFMKPAYDATITEFMEDILK